MTATRRTVELVGYPFATIGIGVQLRSLARVLEYLGLNVVVRDCWRPDMNIVNIDTGQLSSIETDPVQADARIFCSTPQEVVSQYILHPELFKDIPTVAHYAWEFDRIPRCLKLSQEITDEVWAISRFCAQAFRSEIKSALVIPNSIEHCKDIEITKSKIKNQNVSVLTCLDVNSSLQRKNPKGAIAALQNLSAKHEKNMIDLTIKLNNANSQSVSYITEALMNFPIKEIITETQTGAETLKLVADADVFVSLHRSEGFGLVIAEAMALNTAVITTAFSGNMDFCTAENSYLVDFDLVPMSYKEYPHIDWGFWAEPDLEGATEQLKSIIADRDQLAHKTQAAHEDIWKKYSAAAIAKELRKSKLISDLL